MDFGCPLDCHIWAGAGRGWDFGEVEKKIGRKTGERKRMVGEEVDKEEVEEC